MEYQILTHAMGCGLTTLRSLLTSQGSSKTRCLQGGALFGSGSLIHLYARKWATYIQLNVPMIHRQSSVSKVHSTDQ